MRGLLTKFSISGELLGFLWTTRRWWMIPMIFLLLLVGGLIMLAQSTAIAPFIYTLF